MFFRSLVSAAVASAITFPLDVVKTRIQVNDATLVDAMKNVRFSGFVPRVLFGEHLIDSLYNNECCFCFCFFMFLFFKLLAV